ncbi:MAG: histidine phosphatase family protein [Pseudomonadota bacterium]
MKTLIILRHAKSSWAQPGLTDFERPLNGRGCDQVQRLATWFDDQTMPGLAVVSSPSNRTRETLAGIMSGLSKGLGDSQPVFIDDLYNGSMDDYLSAIWAQADTVQTLVVIGHNPTCDELSRYLTAPSSAAAQKLMAHHFGTACLARFEIPAETWADIRASNNQLTHFVRPADLETAPAV